MLPNCHGMIDSLDEKQYDNVNVIVRYVIIVRRLLKLMNILYLHRNNLHEICAQTASSTQTYPNIPNLRCNLLIKITHLNRGTFLLL